MTLKRDVKNDVKNHVKNCPNSWQRFWRPFSRHFYLFFDNLLHVVFDMVFEVKFFNRAAKNTMKKIYEKFTLTAYFSSSKKPNKPKPKCSDDNIGRVRRSIKKKPTTSSRRRFAHLNIVHTTLHRIIHEDLGICIYTEITTMKNNWLIEGILRQSNHIEKWQFWLASAFTWYYANRLFYGRVS